MGFRRIRWKIWKKLLLTFMTSRFLPPTPLQNRLRETLRVWGVGKWNEKLIRECFHYDDAELILGIPLSSNNRSDSFLWHYDMNGFFSVKSAYRIALAAKSEVQASGSRDVSVWWNKIWNIKLHSKASEREEVERAGELLTEFREADTLDIIGKEVVLRATAGKCWAVPPSGCFKLNVDAAMNLYGGRYEVGIVFRDDQGVVVEAAALSFNGVVSVDVAKANAVLKGLLLAEDAGLFPLIVESDALGMINLYKEVCY
ncbi:hypothetical protein Dsin_011993 [Dipteronia sinensis]|uniref:RNase H type-1 domain-containing protein n=1 Tax=Dipteronia sinensis TaxID=43782 RepID=A0AAE0AH65_9ROSI|nr:hypothetical protein Dsin_011993 [Dipteronia sinensis]